MLNDDPGATNAAILKRFSKAFSLLEAPTPFRN